MDLIIKALPLTPERFAPYGDVIEAAAVAAAPMNEARFDRYDELASLECAAGGRMSIGIVRCRRPTRFPHRFDIVERHPLASQAFIPLERFPFVVVVAPPADTVAPGDLRAFCSSGGQGVNYRRGTWHMPLVAARERQEFLVVDLAAAEGNCEERVLEHPVLLDWDPGGRQRPPGR